MYAYPYPWIYDRLPAAESTLLSEIAQAINGEYSSIACYGRLLQLAPGEEAKTRIEEIRQDEIRHYQTFSRLFFRLSGRKPTPQLSEECPSDYLEGIRFAFRDEQKTADSYHSIADGTGDLEVREAFRRAAFDEQNHAVWFLYFLTVR
ncbi:ferritin-like domain-containing protein [Cohnella caldifontis]|uniref:ferritin-like domain-containing protein n=1 Tax=Cohnella caldifontis TaxID=3027471 RepID=UPI0023EC2B40|nr:ferritin-like domain-containing protein [Cohnella sp. YIM B05605]